MLVFACFGAMAVSLIVCRLMIQLGPRDAPDGGRKTQAMPVPSSGGVGIMAGTATGLAFAAAFDPALLARLAAPPLMPLFGFALFAGALGWVDDVRSMPASLKLVLLLGAAFAAAGTGVAADTVWIAQAGIALPFLVAVVLAAAWMFVMANAVNFMDGANGIAMGTAALILAGLALLFLPEVLFGSDSGAAFVLAFTGAAAILGIAGFLIFNLPGRLYAGDAGALAVGGLIGGLSVMFAQKGPLLVPLALCLPILVDVFMTLGWRALRRRPLMQAHREHAYQLCLRAGWTHAQVARLWWGMTLACLLVVFAGPVAATTGVYGARGLPLDLIAFGGLLATGISLWLRQRLTLGRRLEAEGLQISKPG